MINISIFCKSPSNFWKKFQLIFQNNCNLLTTPMKWQNQVWPTCLDISCFGILLHFICPYGCVLILLVQVVFIPTMLVKDIEVKWNSYYFYLSTFSHICGVMIIDVYDVWYIKISNYWIIKCKIFIWAWVVFCLPYVFF